METPADGSDDLLCAMAGATVADHPNTAITARLDQPLRKRPESTPAPTAERLFILNGASIILSENPGMGRLFQAMPPAQNFCYLSITAATRPETGRMQLEIWSMTINSDGSMRQSNLYSTCLA